MPYLFLAEPNHAVTVNIERIQLAFDAEGKLYMSDDHPALERMKANFEHQEISLVADQEPEDKIKCSKCDASFDNRGQMMAHYRKEHPKGAE